MLDVLEEREKARGEMLVNKYSYTVIFLFFHARTVLSERGRG
jgi:hypothetical protein